MQIHTLLDLSHRMSLGILLIVIYSGQIDLFPDKLVRWCHGALT